MNLKGTMVSIVTAMLVMPLFASSAMAAIIVDGDPSDWDPDDKLCGDEGAQNAAPPGYNITSLWARIENNIFYARMDMLGVPGDADDDGNDTTDTLIPEGDWPGVGNCRVACSCILDQEEMMDYWISKISSSIINVRLI